MEAPAKQRWLVTAWPGMGAVAVTAVVYLLSKLRMRRVAEFDARDLFELEHAEVRGGLLRAERLPRSRLFLAEEAAPGFDVLAFLGEAQPPTGKFALCRRLLDKAAELGATRVCGFAAWVTGPEPMETPSVHGVATDARGLEELRALGVAAMTEGRIGGLNGVLLAAAAERGLRGVGLLGEMPSLLPDLPYPAASAAVLRVFARMTGLALDLDELEAYGQQTREQLSGAYQQALRAMRAAGPRPEEGAPAPPARRAGELDEEDEKAVEELFRAAGQDRSKAFALKTELDRLGVFKRYEDRFLSLFKAEDGEPPIS